MSQVVFEEPIDILADGRLLNEPLTEYIGKNGCDDAMRIRHLINAWFEDYPEREKSELRSRFLSRADSNVRSAFHELYLHRLITQLGYSMEIHPRTGSGRSTRPDFMAEADSCESFYLEAVGCSEESDAERGGKARVKVLIDYLNRKDSRNFFLKIRYDGLPETAPPLRKWWQKIEEWLRGIDPDEVLGILTGSGTHPLPSIDFDHGNWKITVKARPKRKELRGKPGHLVQSFFPGIRTVNSAQTIREAVKKKATKYGDLDLPYVVAVNVQELIVDNISLEEVFLGSEQYFGEAEKETIGFRRAGNGLFSPEPRNAGISGILLTVGLHPARAAVTPARLFHNPMAQRPLRGKVCRLPQAHILDGELQYSDGVEARRILGL